MTETVDIFQAEADGDVLWIGSAISIDEAKVRVQELAENSPGDFVLLNHKTGHKVVVKLD